MTLLYNPVIYLLLVSFYRDDQTVLEMEFNLEINACILLNKFRYILLFSLGNFIMMN